MASPKKSERFSNKFINAPFPVSIMIIAVTGTPGTGKTETAKLISRTFDIEYLSINDIIKRYKLASSYDKKRKCFVVDPKKIEKTILKIIKKEKKYIIDSHLSQWIFPKKIDLCIVTTCPLHLLKKRLSKRKYSKAKVEENMDAERFKVCFMEAKENLKCPVLVFDTTKDKKEFLKNIEPFIKRFIS